MKEILSIDPLTVYALHKIGGVIIFIGILSFLLFVLSYLMVAAQKKPSRLSWSLFFGSLAAMVVCFALTALLPTWEEVKAFVTLRAVSEVSQSDLGQKTQEVITSWLDNKLNNTTK